ncbi:zinc-binding alcohol dehydrogenase family protein [Pedobacter sp. PAMC26386]|nr:zinc-binding alcohol dehydrogenase family protein [Pedobacter sp. PAMC26386]
MKAAVLSKSGGTPGFADFPDPILKNDEKLVVMKTASIKNLDKMKVAGSHYDSYQNFPTVVGVDGVGILEDGSRVYMNAPGGVMAEKVAVSPKWMIAIPDNLDDVTAAAIPNPAISAWLSLELKGKLKAGDSVTDYGRYWNYRKTGSSNCTSSWSR